jgi:phosphatidylglycerophosphate synthase
MLGKIDKALIRCFSQSKVYKDKIFFKLTKPFADAGVSADVVSIFGLISGIASGFFLETSRVWFIVFWALKRFLDLADGPIARQNHIQVFKGVNMDNFCDIAFSLILFTATIPSIGLALPFIAVATHAIHVLFDANRMSISIFSPSNYAQFFFLFGAIKAGLIFQVAYTVVAFVYMRIRYK